MRVTVSPIDNGLKEERRVQSALLHIPSHSLWHPSRALFVNNTFTEAIHASSNHISTTTNERLNSILKKSILPTAVAQFPNTTNANDYLATARSVFAALNFSLCLDNTYIEKDDCFNVDLSLLPILEWGTTRRIRILYLMAFAHEVGKLDGNQFLELLTTLQPLNKDPPMSATVAVDVIVKSSTSFFDFNSSRLDNLESANMAWRSCSCIRRFIFAMRRILIQNSSRTNRLVVNTFITQLLKHMQPFKKRILKPEFKDDGYRQSVLATYAHLAHLLPVTCSAQSAVHRKHIIDQPMLLLNHIINPILRAAISFHDIRDDAIRLFQKVQRSIGKCVELIQRNQSTFHCALLKSVDEFIDTIVKVLSVAIYSGENGKLFKCCVFSQDAWREFLVWARSRDKNESQNVVASFFAQMFQNLSVNVNNWEPMETFFLELMQIPKRVSSIWVRLLKWFLGVIRSKAEAVNDDLVPLRSWIVKLLGALPRHVFNQVTPYLIALFDDPSYGIRILAAKSITRQTLCHMTSRNGKTSNPYDYLLQHLQDCGKDSREESPLSAGSVRERQSFGLWAHYVSRNLFDANTTPTNLHGSIRFLSDFLSKVRRLIMKKRSPGHHKSEFLLAHVLSETLGAYLRCQTKYTDNETYDLVMNRFMDSFILLRKSSDPDVRIIIIETCARILGFSNKHNQSGYFYSSHGQSTENLQDKDFYGSLPASIIRFFYCVVFGLDIKDFSHQSNVLLLPPEMDTIDRTTRISNIVESIWEYGQSRHLKTLLRLSLQPVTKDQGHHGRKKSSANIVISQRDTSNSPTDTTINIADLQTYYKELFGEDQEKVAGSFSAPSRRASVNQARVNSSVQKTTVNQSTGIDILMQATPDAGRNAQSNTILASARPPLAELPTTTFEDNNSGKASGTLPHRVSNKSMFQSTDLLSTNSKSDRPLSSSFAKEMADESSLLMSSKGDNFEFLMDEVTTNQGVDFSILAILDKQAARSSPNDNREQNEYVADSETMKRSTNSAIDLKNEMATDESGSKAQYVQENSENEIRDVNGAPSIVHDGTLGIPSFLLQPQASTKPLLSTRLRKVAEFVLRHLWFSDRSSFFSFDYEELFNTMLKSPTNGDLVVREPLHPKLRDAFKLDVTLLLEMCSKLVMDVDKGQKTMLDRGRKIAEGIHAIHIRFLPISRLLRRTEQRIRKSLSVAQVIVLVKDQLAIDVRLSGGGARGFIDQENSVIHWISRSHLDLTLTH